MRQSTNLPLLKIGGASSSSSGSPLLSLAQPARADFCEFEEDNVPAGVARRTDGNVFWRHAEGIGINAIAVHGDFLNPNSVICCLANSQIAVLDNDGKLRVTLTGHVGYVAAVAAQGQICFSASFDSTVRAWRYQYGECVAMNAGHSGAVHDLCYDGDTKCLITASSDKTLRSWTSRAARALLSARSRVGRTRRVGMRRQLLAGLGWQHRTGG